MPTEKNRRRRRQAESQRRGIEGGNASKRPFEETRVHGYENGHTVILDAMFSTMQAKSPYGHVNCKRTKRETKQRTKAHKCTDTTPSYKMCGRNWRTEALIQSRSVEKAGGAGWNRQMDPSLRLRRRLGATCVKTDSHQLFSSSFAAFFFVWFFSYKGKKTLFREISGFQARNRSGENARAWGSQSEIGIEGL